MTPVPKKKHTRSRSNIRRNSLANRLKSVKLQKCPNCNKLKESHRTCSYCGYYK